MHFVSNSPLLPAPCSPASSGEWGELSIFGASQKLAVKILGYGDHALCSIPNFR
jgi:hypothetical protein